MLKQEYKEEGVPLDEALILAIHVLSKTLDVQKLSAEKGSFNCILFFCAVFFRVSLSCCTSIIYHLSELDVAM